MALKIDGYVPADPKVALEQGVDFEYETSLGDVSIRSRSLNPDDNPRMRVALRTYGEWQNRNKKLLKDSASKEEDRRFFTLIHDEGVISWSTTAKSEGKEIAPTRENFIDLMTSPAFRAVGQLFVEDAMDSANFRAVDHEDDAKNSETPSAPSSSGGATV